MENQREEKHAGGSRLAPKAQKPKKEKKPKKPSRLTRQQKVLIVIAVILAVALAAVAACQSLFVRPDLGGKKPGNTGSDGSGDAVEEIDYGDGVRPRADGERKSKDFYTVLILGRDTGGGGNTDTMLLASYDVTNQKATVMSIPRDTMVNIPHDIKRINAVYNYNGGGEKGIQALYKEIAQLVGFEPDYQVIVEWDAVGKIVDAMDGVWFDVPRNMNYEDPYQDLSIHQTKGYRLLSGSDAMQVLRYRHDNDMRYGYPDGDLGRIKTQQALLKAMVEQLLQLKNITKVNEFAKVFQECVETDLSLQNILWFAQSAYLGGLKVENVNFVTMPNKLASAYSPSVSRQTGKNSYQSYVTPIASELLDLVNNELSPFVETFKLSDLDIMSVNGDGSLSSSTGYVEDRQAAKPPVLLYSNQAKPAEEDPVEDPTVDENGNPIDPDGGGTIVVDPNGDPITDPNTGAVTDPGGGTVTDPGTTTPDGSGGLDVNDPGVVDPGTTDPGATTPVTPEEPGAAATETPAEPWDGGFAVIDQPPAA